MDPLVKGGEKGWKWREGVAILENGRVAEEGLELPLRFLGKTYILSIAGDSRGTKHFGSL